MLTALNTPIYVFPNDDGVIHNDTQHKDKREQRDHIDGNPQFRHQPNPAGKRNRNSKCYEKCQARSQEQGQHQKNKHQARGSITHQQTQTSFEQLTTIIPKFQLDPLWQLPRSHIANIVLNCL